MQKVVSRKIAIVLCLVIIMLSIAVVILATNFKFPTTNNTENSDSKKVVQLPVSFLMTSTAGDKLMCSCAVQNTLDQMVYNCRLHIVGVYPNGFQALDKYIPIGNEGIITANTILSGVPSGGLISFNYQANAGTPIWTITAEGTTTP